MCYPILSLVPYIGNFRVRWKVRIKCETKFSRDLETEYIAPTKERQRPSVLIPIASPWTRRVPPGAATLPTFCQRIVCSRVIRRLTESRVLTTSVSTFDVDFMIAKMEYFRSIISKFKYNPHLAYTYVSYIYVYLWYMIKYL